MADNPLNTQVGGNHYKGYSIQPIEYAMANNLNYCQANAIKYVTRYRDKGGKEDLLKAIHNIELLIELEYPEKRLLIGCSGEANYVQAQKQANSWLSRQAENMRKDKEDG